MEKAEGKMEAETEVISSNKSRDVRGHQELEEPPREHVAANTLTPAQEN